jgi:ribosomal protein S27AE
MLLDLVRTGAGPVLLDNAGKVWWSIDFHSVEGDPDFLPRCEHCGDVFTDGFVTDHMHRWVCTPCARVRPTGPGDALTFAKGIGVLVESKPPWLTEGNEACPTTTP